MASRPSLLVSLGFCIELGKAGPATSSMNLNAWHIILRQSILCSPIVMSARRPDWRQSCNMKVLPCRCSRSNETLRMRHIWKNVLYWIFETPGWCRYLVYMKHLGTALLVLIEELAVELLDSFLWIDCDDFTFLCFRSPELAYESPKFFRMFSSVTDLSSSEFVIVY